MIFTKKLSLFASFLVKFFFELVQITSLTNIIRFYKQWKKSKNNIVIDLTHTNLSDFNILSNKVEHIRNFARKKLAI